VANVLDYVAAWNEPDAATRLKILERCWADDGAYVDPNVELRGRSALCGHISKVQAGRPCQAKRASPPGGPGRRPGGAGSAPCPGGQRTRPPGGTRTGGGRPARVRWGAPDAAAELLELARELTPPRTARAPQTHRRGSQVPLRRRRRDPRDGIAGRGDRHGAPRPGPRPHPLEPGLDQLARSAPRPRALRAGPAGGVEFLKRRVDPGRRPPAARQATTPA
jgi:hypothetical protein